MKKRIPKRSLQKRAAFNSPPAPDVALKILAELRELRAALKHLEVGAVSFKAVSARAECE